MEGSSSSSKEWGRGVGDHTGRGPPPRRRAERDSASAIGHSSHRRPLVHSCRCACRLHDARWWHAQPTQFVSLMDHADALLDTTRALPTALAPAHDVHMIHCLSLLVACGACAQMEHCPDGAEDTLSLGRVIFFEGRGRHILTHSSTSATHSHSFRKRH